MQNEHAPLSLALPEETIAVAVVGAHLSGMPLNHELTTPGGTLVVKTQTAPLYRLYELPGTTPRKPGLLRVGAEAGAAIEVEVWALSAAAFGTFVSRIPQPLGIGTLVLEDGSHAKGFLVEEIATRDAEDITRFGGWRAWIAAKVSA
ncbi:amidase [Xinfangfangia sp. D13-10-4-6]|uniref:allophanate hydrolase-related protein n=1 Tax=Pseudogemmobacter hezensis TaxID=2737662 RepID=UPI001553AA25|nr:amidase [Pseudogemmobacter hezensis]NPD17643.1 amidase [Pseudogemmobacter hezensis]